MIAAQIGDGADGLWHKNKAVGVAAGLLCHPLGQSRGHHRAGKLVVGHGGMADVGGNKNFFFALAGNHKLAVGQAAWGKCGINSRAVHAGLELLALLVGEAEAPASGIVRGNVGNGIGHFGQRMQVALQILKRERAVHRFGVAHHVQV